MNLTLAFWGTAHIGIVSGLNLWTYGVWGFIAAIPLTFMAYCLCDAIGGKKEEGG